MVPKSGLPLHVPSHQLEDKQGKEGSRNLNGENARHSLIWKVYSAPDLLPQLQILYTKKVEDHEVDEVNYVK